MLLNYWRAEFPAGNRPTELGLSQCFPNLCAHRPSPLPHENIGRMGNSFGDTAKAIPWSCYLNHFLVNPQPSCLPPVSRMLLPSDHLNLTVSTGVPIPLPSRAGISWSAWSTRAPRSADSQPGTLISQWPLQFCRLQWAPTSEALHITGCYHLRWGRKGQDVLKGQYYLLKSRTSEYMT